MVKTMLKTIVDGRPALFELRVASTTDVNLLATSLTKNVEEGKSVSLSCIGLQPLSQAVKAVAVGNGFTAPHGFVFVMMPSFSVTKFPDRETGEVVERTAIKFTLVKYWIGSDG
jgi:stage V sporulation protein SpoVS